MAGSKGGRPLKDAGDGGTHPVRVFKDTAQMVIDLSELLNLSTANILDPFVRDQVAEKWNQHRAAIEQMKALDAEKERIRKQVEEKAAKKKRSE